MQQIKRKLHNVLRRINTVKNWPLFMWPLAGIVTWPRIAKLRSGGKIFIRAFRSSDFAFLNEIVIEDIYHTESFVAPQKIIDVGANIGVFTILVAKMFPQATVISIEPEKVNFESLKKNIALSDAQNVVAINGAVSTVAGDALLYVSTANAGNHSLYGDGNAVMVKTHTLNELLPAGILKLDAEGIEYEIFKENVPDFDYIVMETHTGDDKSLFARLETKYERTSRGPIHLFKHK